MAKKPFKRGLVVGKFSPLHKGHEYLIQSAFNQCIEVVVISYSRPEFPSCSANIREHWIKSVFNSAKVLCVDAATVESWRLENSWEFEMPKNDESDSLHRHFTYQLLAQKLGVGIDAVFTSEAYGDGFAQFLSDPATGFGSQVAHVCVDLNRSVIPISGSRIRARQTPEQTFINPYVRKEFGIKKILLLGAESTGKSTISKLLAVHFKEPLVEEYGRELWEAKHGKLTAKDLKDICLMQTAREDLAQHTAKNYIFCDTSPITTLCYSEALFKQRCKVIDAYAERPYQHVFLCEPDFPLVQDGTRKNEEFRLWQHNWYLKELALRNIPYTALTGSVSFRADRVIQILAGQSV